jgi:triphosphatase
MDLARPSLVLHLDAKAFETIRKSLLLRHVTAGSGAAVPFRQDRIDTQGFDLWQGGVALKRTQEGLGAELHLVTHLPAPFALRFEAGKKGAALARVLELALGFTWPKVKTSHLEPFGAERGKRWRFSFAMPAWSIRLDLEKGSAKAGRRRANFHRAVLELEKGKPEDLARLVSRLAEIAPSQLEIFSGGALIDGAEKRRPAPRKSRPIQLVRGALVRHTLRFVLLSCLDHFCVNLAVLGGGDPVEAVHQMRVALRRLRSAVGLFAPLLDAGELQRLKPELRWLGNTLGGVRDLDVFLSSIHAPVRQVFPKKKELAVLESGLRKVRNKRFRDMRRLMEQPRAVAVQAGVWAMAEGLSVSSSSAKLDGPVEAYAKGLLERRYAKIVKAGERFEQLSPEERHRLRIQAKKLRYASEFFLALFEEKPAKAYLAKLMRLLDALGHLNDLAVAHATLDAPPDGKNHAKASAHVLGWHAERKEKLLIEARNAWRSFKATQPFWQ